MTFSLLRFRQVGNSIIDQTISIYCLSGKIVRAASFSKKSDGNSTQNCYPKGFYPSLANPGPLPLGCGRFSGQKTAYGLHVAVAKLLFC